MKVESLRTFMTIADAGSYMGAARLLGLGQPAISKQMVKLEQELGTRLLVRAASGVRLTTAGRALLVEARKIVELNDRAIARARIDKQRGRRGMHGASAEVVRSREALIAAIAAIFADREPGADIAPHGPE